MTLAVMAPTLIRGRAIVASSPSTRTPSTPSKIKTFFDELVNIPSKSSAPARPRLIYVRDFPVLAPTSSIWFPPLLSAVRQRRQGPMSRPSSPVSSPMTIIFGMTPPYYAAMPDTVNSDDSRYRHQSAQAHASSSKSVVTDSQEDGYSDWARERRIRERLRRWEQGDAFLHDELPTLANIESEEGGHPKPDFVLIGNGNSEPGLLPPILSSAIAARALSRAAAGAAPTAQPQASRFFRTSVLVPSVRSLIRERACRVARRREINEITMRMGVNSVNGALGPRQVDSPDSAADASDEGATLSDGQRMWEDWGDRIEEWSTVKRIADRAVGSVVSVFASAPKSKSDKLGLEPTDVPWGAVHSAWAAQQASQDMRKTWIKSSAKPVQEGEADGERAQESVQEDESDVIERVKQDPNLNEHDARLLACIVNPGSATVLRLIRIQVN